MRVFLAESFDFHISSLAEGLFLPCLLIMPSPRGSVIFYWLAYFLGHPGPLNLLVFYLGVSSSIAILKESASDSYVF